VLDPQFADFLLGDWQNPALLRCQAAAAMVAGLVPQQNPLAELAALAAPSLIHLLTPLWQVAGGSTERVIHRPAIEPEVLKVTVSDPLTAHVLHPAAGHG